MASALHFAAEMGANDPTRRIAILSDNPDTLQGLEGYLRNVGLPAICRRQLTVVDLVAESTRAILLFPDDFPEADVKAALEILLARGGSSLKIIVSARPGGYEAMLAERNDFVVIARPVWGWAIVDAIRLYESVADDGQTKACP